jgi:hypothetical protein
MIWFLISFTEITMPLDPSEGAYVIGIVENEYAERKMVRIDNEWKDELIIGMSGMVESIQKGTSIISVFQPQ